MKNKSTYEWHKHWSEVAVNKVHTLYGTESKFILQVILLLVKGLHKKEKESLLNQLLSER